MRAVTVKLSVTSRRSLVATVTAGGGGGAAVEEALFELQADNQRNRSASQGRKELAATALVEEGTPCIVRILANKEETVNWFDHLVPK
jgi:hypothetical protein